MLTILSSAVTCGFPGSPSKGSVSPSGSSHKYGTVATFSCEIGYNLQGSATRTCQGDSQWSGAVPVCQSKSCTSSFHIFNNEYSPTLRGKVVSCETPDVPAHGASLGSNFEYRGSVVYTCDSGYNLVGEGTITCLESGQWSASAPSCERNTTLHCCITCSSPFQPHSRAMSIAHKPGWRFCVSCCNSIPISSDIFLFCWILHARQHNPNLSGKRTMEWVKPNMHP